MTMFFSQIWHAGLTAGFVVLAVLVLRLCFRKAPRWIAVALWALVAVRLLVPVTLTSPVSVVPPLPQAVVFDTPVDNAADETPSVTVSETVGGEIVNQPAVEPPAEDAVTLSLETVATVVWVGGMAVMATYMLVSTARLRRRVRTATKLEGRLYQSEAVTSPFILGVLSPKIYLPYGLDAAVQESVIAHETAHIKRGDHLIKPLAFLLLSVYWFQPLLWVAYICLCRDIEAACDEKAIKALGDDARKEYSYALVTLGVQDRRRIAACPLAFGEVSVKERVKRVMSYKKPTVWILSAALVLSSVAAVCLLTDRAPKVGEATFKDATLVVKIPTKAALDHEEPLVEGASFTVRDHTPIPNKITILSVNERDLTVKVGLERALYLDGKLTNTVELSYDETLSLTAPMYKGETCSYLVHIELPRADHDLFNDAEIEALDYNLGRRNLTRYTGGEVTLRLYDGWFLMTYGEQYDYKTMGTWEDDGETLTLIEDAGLTRQVFRKQADGSLVYDKKASYRHKKAKALELANGDALGFDFCYEVKESGIANATRYTYAIKKADGTAWIERSKAKSKPWISFAREDVLCVTMDYAGEETQQYINLSTGEISKAYHRVVCQSADAIAELIQNEQGKWGVQVSAFDVGTYAASPNAALSENAQFFALKNVSDIDAASVSVRLDGKQVFFSYTDDDGKEHIEAYLWTTREPIKQAVIVLGNNGGTVFFSRLVNGAPDYYTDGLAYGADNTPREIYTEAEQMSRKVYYVGGIRAAVYLDGEYVDLRSALKDGRITIDTLVENLREDAKNGITGSMMYRDGGTTIYFYGDSDEDDVTVRNKLNGDRDIYIGGKVY
ncbi:MAG: M56 family metallopeptidase [Clostridia bacterium]|nr:M56 family metallopeptidase [Clostridia bacterium]